MDQIFKKAGVNCRKRVSENTGKELLRVQRVGSWLPCSLEGSLGHLVEGLVIPTVKANRKRVRLFKL